MRGVVRNKKADPKMRAITLCCLEHLVGDLHQPLHCATLIKTKTPKGDTRNDRD